MSLATIYLKNLAKRVIVGGEVHPSEIRHLPKFIDKTFGDGDGILEMSDIVEATKEVGGDLFERV